MAIFVVFLNKCRRLRKKTSVVKKNRIDVAYVKRRFLQNTINLSTFICLLCYCLFVYNKDFSRRYSYNIFVHIPYIPTTTKPLSKITSSITGVSARWRDREILNKLIYFITPKLFFITCICNNINYSWPQVSVFFDSSMLEELLILK